MTDAALREATQAAEDGLTKLTTQLEACTAVAARLRDLIAVANRVDDGTVIPLPDASYRRAYPSGTNHDPRD